MFDIATATAAELSAQFNQDLVKVIKLAPHRNIAVKNDEMNSLLKEMEQISNKQAEDATAEP